MAYYREIFGLVSSHANRGNVAVICWNTLNSKTWYVKDEDLDGNVSLGSDDKSLLAINFADYTVETTGELKETDDDVVVSSTPARNAEIGDRQIVLEGIADDYDFDFETNPKKAKKETTTYVKDGDVVAYVPEEVYSDLDSLKGHKVTVVFGEDNVVALIVVEDDVAETALLTKYDNDKVTVDGTSYKLAKKYTVELNEKKYSTLDAALATLDIDDLKDIEKAIETTLTLDEDNKVEKIQLFASATIANVSTEALVIKVKETSKKYKIETVSGSIEWNIDDEDDIDFPRVYVDGTKADIRDIEAGSVLTVIGKSLDLDDISTIYVSTKTVVGEATKVKKSNNAITVDGEAYMPSFELVVGQENGKDVFASIMTKEELKENDWDKFDSTTILDNDEVTLYMNVLGEYVAVSIEENTNDYQFGVVTYISSNITWEGDDEDIAVRNIKILLPDDTKKTFKVKADTSDEDVDATQVTTDGSLGVVVGDFVIFEANSDNVITIEDGDEIEKVENNYDDKDYVAKAFADLAVDGKTFAVAGETDKDYAYTSKTVIFNKHTKTQTTGDKDKYEIVTDWDSIIDDDDKLPTTAYAIFEKDSKKASYIVVNMGDYTSSDAEYAIVASKLVEVKDGKYEIDFVGNPDMQVKNEIADLKNAIDWFIKYTTASGKVNAAAKLIDLDAFENDLDDADLIADVVIDEDGVLDLAEKLAAAGVTKKHLKVEEVTLEKDYASVEYVDEVETIDDVFARGTYYTKKTEYVEVDADAEFDGTEAYYTKKNNAYEVATGLTDFDEGVTYYTAEDVYTVATKYDKNETYFTKSENTYSSATIANAIDSLGLVRLDEDNLVVLDLRDGTVKEISLDKIEKDSYVVIYKEAGVCRTNSNYAGNVVIVVE